MSSEKPYQIPKRLVWNAYRRVKANHGAAGVDGESLAQFEANLKNNLYKVWNRMASGSYSRTSDSAAAPNDVTSPLSPFSRAESSRNRAKAKSFSTISTTGLVWLSA